MMSAANERVIIPQETSEVHTKIALLGICVVVMLSFVFSASAANTVLETAIVNNPNSQHRLNLRAQNNENAELLGKYYNGVPVDILEYLPNDWVRVRIGTNGQDAQGYMVAKYLAFGTAKDSVVSVIPVYEPTTANWTMKASPTNAGASVGGFGMGIQVELLGFSDGWWHIRVMHQTGYVPAQPQFLKLVSGDPHFTSPFDYFDGYRIAIVNNPNPADRLNLRKTANTDEASIGKYYNGVVAAILSDEQDDWLKVRIGNLEGYMESRYLAIDAQIGSIASSKPVVKVSNSAIRLFLREEPSQSSKSLGLYDKGTSMEVLGLNDTWCHVQVDNKIGFMMADYLSPKPEYSELDDNINDSWAAVNNPNPSDRLHLRTSAQASAHSIGKYYNGVKVQVLSFHQGDQWARVSVGGTEGYMMTKYLAFGSEMQQVKYAMPIVRVTGDEVNLREGASLNSNSLGRYGKDISVTVWGICDAWLHVEVYGKIGYMMASLLSPVPGDDPSLSVSGRMATLNVDAYVHEEASLSSTSMAFLEKGTKVTIGSQSDDWYYIYIGNELDGWLQKSVVTLIH